MATNQEAAEVLKILLEKAKRGETITESDFAVSGAEHVVSEHIEKKQRKEARTKQITRYTGEPGGDKWLTSGKYVYHPPAVIRHDFVGETVRNYIEASGRKVDKETRGYGVSPFCETYAEARAWIVAHNADKLKSAKRSLASAVEAEAKAQKMVTDAAALPMEEPR